MVEDDVTLNIDVYIHFELHCDVRRVDRKWHPLGGIVGTAGGRKKSELSMISVW